MTILFIDDDPEDTELFCEAAAYLNSSQFIYDDKQPIDCVTANDGCRAIDLLSKLSEIPNYIFLDINMPGMGGKECLEYLKNDQMFSNVPVIMLSTAVGEREANAFKALGAYDCIKKPCSFKELVGVLSRYIYKKYS